MSNLLWVELKCVFCLLNGFELIVMPVCVNVYLSFSVLCGDSVNLCFLINILVSC